MEVNFAQDLYFQRNNMIKLTCILHRDTCGSERRARLVRAAQQHDQAHVHPPQPAASARLHQVVPQGPGGDRVFTKVLSIA